MRQTNVRGSLSLRGFRKLRTGAIVATGVILLGLGFLAPTVSASEQDGVWVARTVEEVKADLQKEGDLFKYVIKWGDTLSVISEASNIPVDVLQEMNQASGKNLFLPHNELYFTEAETVSDTVTKHKIVIKESGASGEVRTYEVLLKKDQETKAVTFELTDVTEKVEKMTVNYSPVYQPVSAPVVERAEESGEEPASEAPAETSPEVKEETEAPVAPKAEDAATTPAPKETAPEVVTPAPKVEAPAESAEPKGTEPEVAKPTAPKAETPAPKVEESAESAEPKPEVPITPENKEEQPGATEATEAEGTEPEVAKPAEPKAEAPAPKVEEPTESVEPKVTEPEVAKPTEPKAEAPAPKVEESAESVEPKVTEPEATKPTEPKAETPAESTEPKGSVESTPKESTTEGKESAEGVPGTVDSESASKETEEEASTTPSADATNDSGKSESSSPVTDDTTSNVETTDQPENSAPKEDKLPTNQNGDTSNPVDSKDETSNPAPKEGDSTSGATGKEESADSTNAAPETDKQSGVSTENAEGSHVSDETPTNAASSDGSISNEEKPQADEPAVEHQDSEQSLKKETEDSNKAAIDEDRTTKDKEINESTLNEDKKKEALEKVKQLTEEYHKKLAAEQDTEKQVDIVEEYREELAKIETPGVEHDGPDFKKPIESHTGGTTIDENSTVANSALTSSNPSSQPSSSGASSQTQPAAMSDSSTTGNSGFRSAGTYQPRVTRRRRSIEEPQNTVSIYYNFDGMKDIPGFFGDPGEDNTVTIPAGTSEAQAKELVKEKIQAKIKDLAARGYQVKNEIVFEQDTDVKNYNYVVTFTKQTTGTSGFRMAPAVQPRASRNRRSLEQPAPQKVKVNVFYNFDQMKDIAGFLGDITGTPLEIAEGSTDEQVKAAVKSQVEAKKEELRKRGYTLKEDYLYKANGKDYNYVVTFSKATK